MDFEGAIIRIERWTVILALALTACAMAVRGWTWAVGFAIGAAVSWINFRWLRRVVQALGPESGAKPPKKRAAILAGLRYLLLAAGVYAILNYSAISLNATLCGLFVAVAAVVFEIVYELIYGT